MAQIHGACVCVGGVLLQYRKIIEVRKLFDWLASDLRQRKAARAVFIGALAKRGRGEGGGGARCEGTTEEGVGPPL